jgi:hypothetical protein
MGDEMDGRREQVAAASSIEVSETEGCVPG